MEPDGAVLQLLPRAQHHWSRSAYRILRQKSQQIVDFVSSQRSCSRSARPQNARGTPVGPHQLEIPSRRPPTGLRDIKRSFLPSLACETQHLFTSRMCWVSLTLDPTYGPTLPTLWLLRH